MSYGIIMYIVVYAERDARQNTCRVQWRIQMFFTVRGVRMNKWNKPLYVQKIAILRYLKKIPIKKS